jgi:hypothetical protein
MRREKQRGVSTVEFAFITLSLVPLLIGTGVIGINLVRTLGTEQVARDAGHMYSRGVDFSQPGNQQILATIGSGIGLSATAGSGSAEVILSKLTYVDTPTCAAAGAVDSKGNPSGCTNYGKWVFTQRLTVGNSSIRSSNIGSPTGVTISSNGTITVQQYATVAGAVATFNSINPYADVNGNVSGLPSGQMLYIAEASASEYTLPPYTGGGTYAFGLF